MEQREVFVSDGIRSVLKGRYIYLDNDFLGVLYGNKETFSGLFPILSVGVLMIDPFTKFEFLRDIFLPNERVYMENFVDSSIFTEPPNHNDVFQKIQINGMILSRIYSHQGRKNGISTVDLLLAGRLMYNNNTLLITGNKKDFPSCVFNILGVINIENKNNGSLQSFSILEFDVEKFNVCNGELNKVLNKKETVTLND